MTTLEWVRPGWWTELSQESPRPERRDWSWWEAAVLALAIPAVMMGVLLLAYYGTLAIVEGPGHPYPNVQHASTIPTPPSRR